MKTDPAISSIRILFVDDEEEFVHVITKRLVRRGIRVTVALSGTQGIRTLRKQQFDVAVVDLKMDDINGIEVLKIFKKMHPEMAVIMLTGHGSNKAAQEGIRAGAFAYLAKPCNLEELIKKIVEAAGKREGADG